MEFRSTYTIEFPLLCRIMSKWPYKILLSFIPRWQFWSNWGLIKKFCHNSSMIGSCSQIQPPPKTTTVENQKLGIEVSEISMVMKRLGLGEEDSPSWGPQDLVGLDGLFEEEEPSFGEIKEAFDVFDQNRDGLVDALELQRVLSILGLLKGGSHTKNLEICKRILGGFDHKGVDFNDFVRLLETCFLC